MAASRDASSKTRRARVPHKKIPNTCQDRLRKDAKIIKIVERIDTRRAKYISDAVRILQHPQAARDAQIYAQFLKDIIRLASPGHAVLCAASLGQQRLSHLKEHERADVVQFVKENKEGLSCEVLTSLAEEYGIGSFGALANTTTPCEPDQQVSDVLAGRGEVPPRRDGDTSEQNTHRHAPMQYTRAGLNATNPQEDQSPSWRIPLPGKSHPRVICHL